MAAANFAPPLHHRHRHRLQHYLSGCSPPNSTSLLISRTRFLWRKPALSSSFWVLIVPTRTTHGQLPIALPPLLLLLLLRKLVPPRLSRVSTWVYPCLPKDGLKTLLAQFDAALTLDPNPVEAQAALYNKACCHAYREEAKKAADCLRTALREYDLKFGTILNDPDLASFRAMPEFKELQEEARLGGEDIGYSFRRDLKLISEVQAPFRGIRRFFYVALSAAAGISLLFTYLGCSVLLKGVMLRDTARPVSDPSSLTLLHSFSSSVSGVKLGAEENSTDFFSLYLFVFCFLLVVVILAGDKETVASAMRKADRFRTELLRRGVILVPVVWGQGREPQVERKGFGLSPKATASLPSIGEEFDKRAQSIVAQSKIKAEIRFRAEVVSPAEWERWIRDQQKSEGITPGEDVYIILRLDGRVRKSGGMPDWQEIVKEVPPMEAFLSKLER
ncbi:UNVERIFIED_CONTAM: protein LOW PSII ACCUMULATION 1, chloroplastic [Sesamum radiatum]|uniref:Protein LOW PSII ACCUMULATION 1, chloroplastic n=1 Tax=Sesamum radiatum TaxID=300843 RepID=A0AAW2W1N1_SESRA